MSVGDADLRLPDVLHGEVEPDSEARVAGVRPDEEVKLKIIDVVNAAQVSCGQNEAFCISMLVMIDYHCYHF